MISRWSAGGSCWNRSIAMSSASVVIGDSLPGPLCLGTGCNYSPLLAICQR
nr:MAG TPA: hypothetical protein [Caudoviricetes sp.]